MTSVKNIEATIGENNTLAQRPESLSIGLKGRDRIGLVPALDSFIRT